MNFFDIIRGDIFEVIDKDDDVSADIEIGDRVECYKPPKDMTALDGYGFFIKDREDGGKDMLVLHIDNLEFVERQYDFEKNQEIEFGSGEKFTIIDFPPDKHGKIMIKKGNDSPITIGVEVLKNL